MAKKQAVEKTNAMRKLDAMKIPFQEYTYEGDGTLTGVDVAAMLGQNADQVFKCVPAFIKVNYGKWIKKLTVV